MQAKEIVKIETVKYVDKRSGTRLHGYKEEEQGDECKLVNSKVIKKSVEEK